MQLPGRDPNLPRLVRVPSHILLKHVRNVKNVYIVPLNATPQEQARFFHRFAKNMKLPPGTYEGVTAAGVCNVHPPATLANFRSGYAILQPGGFVFGRNMLGDRDPLHDELLAYVAPE